MSKRRKFKEKLPVVVQEPAISQETIDRIYQEAEAEGEHLVMALCDVARDPLAPLTAAHCMRLLKEFDEP